MEAHLMFREKNFKNDKNYCFGYETLRNDLELDIIITEMAKGDEIIKNVCREAMFHPLCNEDEIRYRQDNLRDALKSPDALRELYETTVEAEKKRQESWSWLSPSNSVSRNFSDAVNLLTIYTHMLMKLRSTADESSSAFTSEGFGNFFLMIKKELSDEYFSEVRTQLNELKNDKGVLISSKLGNSLQGVSYVLRRKNRKGFWRRWNFCQSFYVSPQDDAGMADLDRRKARGMNEATDTLARAADNLKDFFVMLRRELAFYVGCINLADTLERLGMPVCIPDLLSQSEKDRSWAGLYDISLTIAKNRSVVGNSFDSKNKMLYIITGANQGGKSTFLRSMGQAQLMAQCGMFAGAGQFKAPIRKNIFTHFKKEEDSSMRSGKLDEELCRMDSLADHITEGSLVLFNESFASTNEREGSEICRQITQALIENGVEVFSVTHLYTFAKSFETNKETQYLRAERFENGQRPFKITEGEPLETAFGEDLYREIFA